MRKIKCKLLGLYQLMKFDNSFELILNRTFFCKNGVNIYRMKGMQIIIDHEGGDENGTRAVLVTNMYKKYLDKLSCKLPINVLDLGANGGGWLLLVEMMGFRLRKIVAVEMNPYTYSRLQFNITHNLRPLDDPVILNKAICGKSKSYTINFGRGSTSDSLYNSNDAGETREITGETLDKIYEKYFSNEIINICKIDVEGAEFEVFERIPKAIKYIEYIIMEVHKKQEENISLLSKLEKHGFRLLNDSINSDNVFFLKNENINYLLLDE